MVENRGFNIHTSILANSSEHNGHSIFDILDHVTLISVWESLETDSEKLYTPCIAVSSILL